MPKQRKGRKSSGEKSTVETSSQQKHDTASDQTDLAEVVHKEPEPSDDVTNVQGTNTGARPKTLVVGNPGGMPKERKNSVEKSPVGTSSRREQDTVTRDQTDPAEVIPEEPEPSDDITNVQETNTGARPKTQMAGNLGGKPKKSKSRKSSGDKSPVETSSQQDTVTRDQFDLAEVIPEEPEPCDHVTNVQEANTGAIPKTQIVGNPDGKKKKKKKKKPAQILPSSEQSEDQTSKEEINKSVKREVGEVSFVPGKLPSGEVLSEHVLRMAQDERFDIGDHVYECFPLAHALNNSEMKFRCDWCLFRFRKTRVVMCGNCRYTCYCSFICKDPEFSKTADPVGHDIVSFSELKVDEERFLRTPELEQSMYAAFEIQLQYLGEDMVSVDRFIEIYSRFDLHSTNIYSGVGKEIGVGLYLGLSAFPHSCRPSTYMSFIGPVARVTSMEKLQQKHISLISVNHFRYLFLPGEERRAFLKEKILLNCHCRECKDTEHEALSSEIINAPQEQIIRPQIRDVIAESKRCYPQTINGAHDLINELEIALDKMNGVYGPQHLLRLDMLHMLSEYLFDVCSLVRCKEVTLECMSLHKFHFGENNPGLLVYVFRLSHIEMFFGSRDKAKKLVTASIQLVRVCFGHDHPFYRHMVSVYNECEKEHWRVGRIMKNYPRNLYDY